MPESDQNKYAKLDEQEQNYAHPEDHRPRDEAAQQTVTIALPPEVPTSSPSEPTRNKRYNTKAAFVTGVLQICVWVVLLIFAIIIMSFVEELGHTRSTHHWITNFLPGVLYLVTGIFGVVSRNRNTRVIFVYMVLCIVSAVGAGIVVIVGALFTRRVYNRCYWNTIYHPEETWFSCHKGEYEAIMAGTIISCITCFAELIIAIVAASFCCAGVCGRCSTPTQTAVVTYAPVAPGGQVYGQVVMMVPTQGTHQPQYSLPQNPAVVHGQATA